MLQTQRIDPTDFGVPGSSVLHYLLEFAQITMDVSLSELREMVLDREAWRAAIHGPEPEIKP